MKKLSIALIIVVAVIGGAFGGRLLGQVLLLPPPVDFQICGGEAVLPADLAATLAIWKAQGCNEFYFKDINYVDGTLLGYGVKIQLAP